MISNKTVCAHVPASERLHFLDNMRAIAIIMVVGVHTLGYCLELPAHQREIISFIVHTISVPVFFLVDGYLFAISMNSTKSYNYLRIVRSSIFRLFIPWAIFTFFYTLLRYAFEYFGLLKLNLILDNDWKNVIISAYGSVYAPQMYFLFSLFLIRLCAPVLKYIATPKSYYASLLAFILYSLIYTSIRPYISPYLTIPGGQEPILHALWGLQFYIAGILIFKSSLFFNIKKMFFPALTFFVIALLAKGSLGTHASTIIQYLYLLTFFILFTLFHKAPSVLSLIGKNTMGIYLIHSPIVLAGVSLALNKFVVTPMLSYLSIFFSTLLITTGIVLLINIIPYGSLLFGMPYTKNRTS